MCYSMVGSMSLPRWVNASPVEASVDGISPSTMH